MEINVVEPVVYRVRVAPPPSVSVNTSAGETVVIVPFPGTQGPPGQTGPAGDGTQVFNEVVNGTVNGSNLTFTTSQHFQTATTAVYVNGLREVLNQGYTESLGTITLSQAPESGDIVTVDYLVQP